MAIKHAHQTALPDDPTKDVSANKWNADHIVTFTKSELNAAVTGDNVRFNSDTVAVADITGLGSLATQSGTFSGTSSGTNTGDQTTIVGITGTKAQFDTAATDGNFQWVGDAPTAHTHLLAAGATDVTITAANLNALDDGANTTLHFHSADRARAVHTGTQLASTISDFSTAVATSAVVLTTAQTVAGIKTFSDPVGLAAQGATPAAPGSGLLLYGQSVAGMMAAEIRGVGSRPVALQHALYDRRTLQFFPNNAGGTLIGGAIVTYGDLVYNIGQSTTSAYTASPRSGWRNLATTANQQMGFTSTTKFFRGNASNVGGFFFYARAGFESWTNGGRMFVGIGQGNGDVFFEPSYSQFGCGFIIESGDAGLISFVTRSNYSTFTKVSTGLTAVTGKGYDFHISCEPNSSAIGWMIRDVNTGTEVSGTATTNLWTNTQAVDLSVFAGNAALTALGAISFGVSSVYAEWV